MAANLITSNTGEGIVIKRECSQQFSRYATVHFLLYKDFFKHHGNLLRQTFRSQCIRTQRYEKGFKYFLQAKTLSKLQNVFKIINFDAAFPNLNFDTSSSVKPIKNYMLQYLVGIHFKAQPSRSRFLAILQQFDLKCNRTI